MASPIHLSTLPAHGSLRVLRMKIHGCDGMGKVIHDHASMALYLGGRGGIWCGASYPVEAGDILLIPEGMPHFTRSSEHLELIGLSLCSSCLSTSQGGQSWLSLFSSVAQGESAVRRPDQQTREKIEWLLNALAEELAHSAPHSLAVDGLLSVLAVLVQRASPSAMSGPQTSVNPLVGAALAFIVSQATEGISLVDVAHHVGRSRTHVATLIRTETGQTVVEWITHSRLAAAKQLLLRTDESVDVIASRVGFASPSHFHRTFRRVLGSTPGAWRGTHRSAALTTKG